MCSMYSCRLTLYFASKIEIVAGCLLIFLFIYSQIGDHRPQYAFLNGQNNGHQQQHHRGSSLQPPQYRPPPASTTTGKHSSEIRGLRSIKCSRKTLQNLLYFMYKKTHEVFFVFHFVQLYIYPL